MIRLERDLNAALARDVLRRLRDMSIGPCAIEVTPHERVELAGCTSRHEPVERGVRFELGRGDGRRELLTLGWRNGTLDVQIGGAAGRFGAPARRFFVELACDRHGRIVAPAIRARLDPRHPAPRELEHFLRRLVRSACAPALLP